MIKKFKNRKIILDIREDLKSGYYEKNIYSVENFYHNDMFMSDLCINQINGYPYIVDYNTQTVYDLPPRTQQAGQYEHQESFLGLLQRQRAGAEVGSREFYHSGHGASAFPV